MSTTTNELINRGCGEFFRLESALAIWDNEGGAGLGGAQESSIPGAISSELSSSAIRLSAEAPHHAPHGAYAPSSSLIL